MNPFNIVDDRRHEIRNLADDVLRWKRPGRAEDHKAWSIDRSDHGIGFWTDSAIAPDVGDRLHIRFLDGDIWRTVDQAVRVARTAPTTSEELIAVGCELEGPAVVEEPISYPW